MRREIVIEYWRTPAHCARLCLVQANTLLCLSFARGRPVHQISIKWGHSQIVPREKSQHTLSDCYRPAETLMIHCSRSLLKIALHSMLAVLPG